MTHTYPEPLIPKPTLRNVITADFRVLGCPSVHITNVRNDPSLNQSNLSQDLIILSHSTSSLTGVLKILAKKSSGSRFFF